MRTVVMLEMACGKRYNEDCHAQEQQSTLPGKVTPAVAVFVRVFIVNLVIVDGRLVFFKRI